MHIRRNFHRLSCLAVIAALGMGSLWAQYGQYGQQNASPLPQPTLAVPSHLEPDLVTPAVPDSYIIGRNDLLSVFVFQMPELTRSVRVDNQGEIQLPFVQRRFHASGLTTPQLQRIITAELQREGLANHPIVQVIVQQVESKPIVVTGAVYKPMALQAARPMSLLEVISRAGGLTSNAGDAVLVTSQGVGPAVTKSYSLRQLMLYNNPQDDPVLLGNESVTVLPSKMIYVVGAFHKPGAFPLRVGEPISVLNAIALAGGLRKSPDKGHAEIISTLPDGTHHEVRIHIGRILKHKSLDPRLRAGDILYVPKDLKHQLLMEALQDTAQVLTLGAAYHFP